MLKSIPKAPNLEAPPKGVLRLVSRFARFGLLLAKRGPNFFEVWGVLRFAKRYPHTKYHLRSVALVLWGNGSGSFVSTIILYMILKNINARLGKFQGSRCVLTGQTSCPDKQQRKHYKDDPNPW